MMNKQMLSDIRNQCFNGYTIDIIPYGTYGTVKYNIYGYTVALMMPRALSRWELLVDGEVKPHE